MVDRLDFNPHIGSFYFEAPNFRNPLPKSNVHTGIFQNVRVKSPINNGIGIGDRMDITGIASYNPIDE